MRILGIDPGFNRTGYALLDSVGRQPCVVEGGFLTADARQPLEKRITEIVCSLAEIVHDFEPRKLAIEQIFSLGKNPKSSLMLAQLRGAILFMAVQNNLEVAHFSPTEVKKTLTGNGHASKEQMQQTVQLEFGWKELPQPHDVADAFAIAFALHSSLQKQVTLN